ncbi:MAG TPA: tetratricopeptide repeat protein [Spirillospora sp.]|nr:tetratricopeptide repeat protein [Spirillospora sp.]
MGRFAAYLWNRFRQWDRAAQIGFGLALILLLLTLLVILFGPRSLRQPALVGLIGLVIVAQIIFMWTNRNMVTPYGRARRLYLAEDFEAACTLLEHLRATGQAGVRELTLLGNAYRQRGLIGQSEAVLLEALDNQPNHHFPLYGFGRTLLVQGRYAEAARVIERALAQGAPPVVRYDAGEACYRSGDYAAACRHIEAAVTLVAEPYRQLMGQYLLFRMGSGQQPVPELISAGLPYWQAHSERYRHTPYGQMLAEDVDALHMLVKEG